MEIIREINDGCPFNDAEKAMKYLSEFRKEDREYFIVIGLDTRNKPTYREIVSIGTLNTSIIHAREVFKKAIIMSCNSIIIAHNHPSGDIEPSPEDKEVTKKLVQAGKLLNIPVLDHIIIGKDDYYSFSNRRKL